MEKKFFAAFIMTYERPEILLETLEKVMSQTFPPELVLIVDNSNTSSTELAIKALNNSRVDYLRVGYNSGPAGAAKIGLQKLSALGYNWIYWGDDDDPPQFIDSFERIFNMSDKCIGKSIGIMGSVGQFYDRWTGNHIRVTDEYLRQSEIIEVDSIAGGHCMIVNAAVVRRGILPDAKLFFGFEELDFCIKVKKNGFSLFVPSLVFLQSRELHGRLNYERPTYTLKQFSNLKRQYYSTRNILLILFSNRYIIAYTYQFLKAFIKSIYGFRFGANYGWVNFKLINVALLHAVIGKTGKIDP